MMLMTHSGVPLVMPAHWLASPQASPVMPWITGDESGCTEESCGIEASGQRSASGSMSESVLVDVRVRAGRCPSPCWSMSESVPVDVRVRAGPR
jgi:hypothetical protein